MKNKITKEEEEDLKEMARSMLIAGKKDGKIVEETGLPIRVVWGLKGDLVKSGKIPMRAKRKKLKSAAPSSSHTILERILNEFGVKERAKEIIISRCKRAGGMHPSELDRCLRDLDTGMNRKEASYITEEYYLVLRAEEDVAHKAKDWDRPTRRYEPVYSDDRYPRRGQPAVSRYEWGYDVRRPWERSYPIRERILTRDDLMNILLALLKCLS